MNFLPQEILIEILRNVDRRKQLSLVSKSFYNAFLALNKDVWLVINSKILNDESTYKSILETTRRIRNIEMKLDFYQKSEDKEKQVLQIIELQSKNITQLVLSGPFFEEFLEEIFKLIPKLNLLDLKDVTIRRIDSSSSPAPSKKMKMSEPEKLNLLQVKKLILSKITSYTSKYILDLMFNLDHGTLNELEVEVETNSYDTIHEFIEKQPNLKVLKLVQSHSYIRQNEYNILPQTFLNNCDLEHLEWKIRYGTIDDAQRDIVDSILKRMKNLKVLKLYHSNNSLEGSRTQKFNIITSNITKLETLEIYAEDIDDTAVVNLNNLTKLCNLTLDFNRLNFQIDIFPMFDQVTLPQLESFAALKMSYVNSNINFIERMSRIFLQNVKKLKIAIPQDRGSFQAILRCFPQIESLTFYQSDRYIKFLVTIPPELQNLNLKELDMTFNLDCTIKSIRELCECFPNLEKLTIRCVGLGDSGLNLLLSNLRMLKYLKLKVPYSSKVPFDKRMNSILKFGHDLEVVIYQAKIGSPDILKMFEDKFEYIKVERYQLVMAVNQKIFNSYPRDYY